MNIDFFGGFYSPLPISNFDINKICYKIKNIDSNHIKLINFIINDNNNKLKINNNNNNINNNISNNNNNNNKFNNNIYKLNKNIIYINKNNIYKFKCLDTKCNKRYNKNIFHIPINTFSNKIKFRCCLHGYITCSKFIKSLQ